MNDYNHPECEGITQYHPPYIIKNGSECPFCYMRSEFETKLNQISTQMLHDECKFTGDMEYIKRELENLKTQISKALPEVFY